MVFQKQINPRGKYVDQTGVRFDVLSCERTESKEWYETGAYETVEGVDGKPEQLPILARRVVLNKGWDSYLSLNLALAAYGALENPAAQEETK